MSTSDAQSGQRFAGKRERQIFGHHIVPSRCARAPPPPVYRTASAPPEVRAARSSLLGDSSARAVRSMQPSASSFTRRCAHIDTKRPPADLVLSPSAGGPKAMRGRRLRHAPAAPIRPNRTCTPHACMVFYGWSLFIAPFAYLKNRRPFPPTSPRSPPSARSRRGWRG